MNLFLTLAFLFCIGSILGWVLEVVFRRFFSAHHWVNPGFLIGPYLPLYGSSLCVLYLLAELEPLIAVEQAWLRKLLLFLLMAVAITLLEYVAGVIFIHGMKIKLWDYSDRWGNIGGIICPLFSFFWMVLSMLLFPDSSPYFVGAALAVNQSGILLCHRIFLWHFRTGCGLFHTPDGENPFLRGRERHCRPAGRTAGGCTRGICQI